MNRKSSSDSNRDLVRYAGMGTQMLVAIGLAVFVGLKTDRWLHSSPLLTCVLPLLVLITIFYKLMKETAKPPEDEK